MTQSNDHFKVVDISLSRTSSETMRGNGQQSSTNIPYFWTGDIFNICTLIDILGRSEKKNRPKTGRRTSKYRLLY